MGGIIMVGLAWITLYFGSQGLIMFPLLAIVKALLSIVETIFG